MVKKKLKKKQDPENGPYSTIGDTTDFGKPTEVLEYNDPDAWAYLSWGKDMKQLTAHHNPMDFVPDVDALKEQMILQSNMSLKPKKSSLDQLGGQKTSIDSRQHLPLPPPPLPPLRERGESLAQSIIDPERQRIIGNSHNVEESRSANYLTMQTRTPSTFSHTGNNPVTNGHGYGNSQKLSIIPSNDNRIEPKRQEQLGRISEKQVSGMHTFCNNHIPNLRNFKN